MSTIWTDGKPRVVLNLSYDISLDEIKAILITNKLNADTYKLKNRQEIPKSYSAIKSDIDACMQISGIMTIFNKLEDSINGYKGEDMEAIRARVDKIVNDCFNQ